MSASPHFDYQSRLVQYKALVAEMVAAGEITQQQGDDLVDAQITAFQSIVDP